ncbi:peptidoglycan DD-metalloendopeptidase family protein [Chelativorans salis]|uniref:Peptidoglycan DD-metalloendopeptidase family protein n=1 Tax=Chelativorans salis TaxID=2978478 RepID=A0ABT2LL82_9HYPH|nr:peptidoglycan DD-metalloendopeptidase family protein [Chelativorans sp. EGI FJ00035]MCT7375351.1 peptidoglycan DD-metalloendopeptidase family protein [Chelativorans sp. EGI FJ00035]
MKRLQGADIFRRRRKPTTIIVADGDDIRYFTVRPWLAAVAGTALTVAAVGYLAATAYLVMRDDLIGSAMARQARLQQAYEDRISALRAQVDRVTSRQLLDQQLMQRKVGELIERQERLSERHGQLVPVLERTGGPSGEEIPVPSPRPDIRADGDGFQLDEMVTGTTYAAVTSSRMPWPIRGISQETEVTKADRTFAAIDHSLRDIEAEQIERVETLAEEVYRTAETIADALGSAGISVADGYGEEDVGGPLIAPAANAGFKEKVRELDEALQRLDELKQTARRIPIANPLPGAAVTSGFGLRRDPILRRPAHHSGVDFRARRGASIQATGAGTVVTAGWNGGYGRMVEVDHGGSITTRYAHLSKILVKPGDKVDAGAVIGQAGSSGRSTGPHLHYEVRHNGTAVNPLKYISAGRRIVEYL